MLGSAIEAIGVAAVARLKDARPVQVCGASLAAVGRLPREEVNVVIEADVSLSIVVAAISLAAICRSIPHFEDEARGIELLEVGRGLRQVGQCVETDTVCRVQAGAMHGYG